MMDCFVKVSTEEFPVMLDRLEHLKEYWQEKSIDYFMEYTKWKQKPFYKKIFSVNPRYKVDQAEEMVSRMEYHKKMFVGSRAVYVEQWLYNEILSGYRRYTI